MIDLRQNLKFGRRKNAGHVLSQRRTRLSNKANTLYRIHNEMTSRRKNLFGGFKLLLQQALESNCIGREFPAPALASNQGWGEESLVPDSLRKFLSGHLILIEEEPEIGLVVDVADFGQGPIPGSVGIEFLFYRPLALLQLIEEGRGNSQEIAAGEFEDFARVTEGGASNVRNRNKNER